MDTAQSSIGRGQKAYGQGRRKPCCSLLSPAPPQERSWKRALEQSVAWLLPCLPDSWELSPASLDCSVLAIDRSLGLALCPSRSPFSLSLPLCVRVRASVRALRGCVRPSMLALSFLTLNHAAFFLSLSFIHLCMLMGQQCFCTPKPCAKKNRLVLTARALVTRVRKKGRQGGIFQSPFPPPPPPPPPRRGSLPGQPVRGSALSSTPLYSLFLLLCEWSSRKLAPFRPRHVRTSAHIRTLSLFVFARLSLSLLRRRRKPGGRQERDSSLRSFLHPSSFTISLCDSSLGLEELKTCARKPACLDLNSSRFAGFTFSFLSLVCLFFLSKFKHMNSVDQ